MYISMCILYIYVRKRIVCGERERERDFKIFKSIIFFFIKNNEYIYRIRKYFSCCNKYVYKYIFTFL